MKKKLLFFCCTVIWLNSAVFIAQADVYMYVGDDGVMHFTNAPTSSDHEYKVYIRERPQRSRAGSYSTDKYDKVIAEASKRYGVDFPLIKAIIKAESDFNPKAISKKGAMGLMQIMPENFPMLNLDDPFNPWENIMAGSRYFKELYKRFNGKLALSLAAYNAGPTAVDRYNKTIPPYAETVEYVRRVLSYYRSYKKL